MKLTYKHTYNEVGGGFFPINDSSHAVCCDGIKLYCNDYENAYFEYENTSVRQIVHQENSFLIFTHINIIRVSENTKEYTLIPKINGVFNHFISGSQTLCTTGINDIGKFNITRFDFNLQEIIWQSESFDFCFDTYLFGQYFIFHNSHENAVLNCINLETGELHWQLDLSQYGSYVFTAHVKSITVYGNILLVPMVSMTLLAIDLPTGAVLWSSERAGGGTGIYLLESKILTFGAGITDRLEVHIINVENGVIEQIIGLDAKLSQHDVLGSITFTYDKGYLYVAPDRYCKHLITIFDITTWEIAAIIPIKIEWGIQKLQVMGKRLFVYDAAMLLHIFEKE